MATASAPASNTAAVYDPATATGKKLNAKAWSTAQDFESVFVNSMFEHMFTGIDGEGPFGGGPAIGVWRSFLTQEYAKSFVKAGGLGLASHVYDALLAHQEASAVVASATKAAATMPAPSATPAP